MKNRSLFWRKTTKKQVKRTAIMKSAKVRGKYVRYRNEKKIGLREMEYMIANYRMNVN